MSTGNFVNWAGEISEIGAIYPFVGSEGFLVIVGLIFWIGWHILQRNVENHETEEESRIADPTVLEKSIREDS